MNTQHRWRLRGRRIKDKVQVRWSHNPRQVPVPNPTNYPRSHPTCPVSEPIVQIDNRIYELLSIFTDRLTRLEHYVYDTSERLKRDQYREDNLPGAETLWRQIQLGKIREFREGLSVPKDQPRIPGRNRRGYYRDDQTDSPGLPRTIDITQCRYCSS
jgi:hypothetical protein